MATRKAKKKAKKKTKKATRSPAPAAGRRDDPGPDLTESRDRARKILRGLKTLYPDADCALAHDSALQLLVATILSAQSTDVMVNKVAPALFKRYPTARALASANPEELEKAIQSTGFFRQKARNVQGACRRLVDAYAGEVPDTMEELVTLPGVARKTANVILGTWFEKNEGIVVDTHVGRLSHRMGLTWSSRNDKDAVKIENDLVTIIPRRDWTFFGHAMILHGRQVCTSRSPRCDDCLLASACPSAFSFGAGGT
ncbi:MAG: endonuclease III [Planctomycetota bacterium]|nr:endonuclease III [Planctomycetota bacterium]